MKRTILIIEDDIIFSRSISNWLKKKNMETECVAYLWQDWPHMLIYNVYYGKLHIFPLHAGNFHPGSMTLSSQTCVCLTATVRNC